MNIRLATPDDARELAKLRWTLRSRPSKNIETELVFLDRCANWMSEALRQTRWRCWVAEQDNSLIGALWLQLIEKIPNPTEESEKIGYITNFLVVASARGQGLGSGILTEALTWCRDQNVHTVILWPTEKSRSLYERHGFSVREDLLGLDQRELL